MSGTLEVLEPATEQVLEAVPRAGIEETDAAVARAKAALPEWRAVSPADRSALLRALSDRMADAHEELALLEARNAGKPIASARGEIGMRFGGDSVFVEPLAQISYLRSSLDAFSVAGTTVNFEHRDGLHGKAGARIGGVSTISENTRMSYYAGASYVHDFKGESAVTFANSGGIYTVSGYRMPDYGEGVAGISIASGRSVSGFMEATYSRTFKNGAGAVASLEGVGGRVGLTAKF